MNKSMRRVAAIAAVCFAATFVQAVLYTWTGGVDNDWSNAANWDGNGIPAVDANGSVVNAANTITIQNWPNNPVVNVPKFADATHTQSASSPRFVIDPGASLSIRGYTENNITMLAATGVQTTVGSGGSLTLSSGKHISFARNTGTQTHNINGGTFNLNAAELLYMGYQAGCLSTVNLDGGTFNTTATIVAGTRGNTGDFSAGFSLVTLNNGSHFNAAGSTLRYMKSTGEDLTLVFDIQDANSDVTFKYGYDFANYAAVTNAFGTVFISSTGLALQAVDNGDGTVTIQPVDKALSVSLTAPANGSSYKTPASISLTADASSATGTITTVDFYNGPTLLGSDTSSPYAYTWTDVATGSYSLTARATDSSGAVTTSAVAVITVTLGGLSTWTWTGGADSDWSNTANWLNGLLPDVDINGSVYGATNIIQINNGPFQPAANIPTLASGMTDVLTAPQFVVKSGASLSINTLVTNNAYMGAQNLTQVTVESGGSLTWSAPLNLYLGYNAGIQSFDISGVFTINAVNLNMGWSFGRHTVVNLDGGTMNFTGNTLYATRSYGGDFKVSHNRINLKNGARFSAPSSVLRNMDGDVNPEVDSPLVFDIQDTASRVIFKFGPYSFYDVWGVTSGFGTTFISSTGLTLKAMDNGDGTCTVTAVEPVLSTDPIAMTRPIARVVYQRDGRGVANVTISGTYTGQLDYVEVRVTPMSGYSGSGIPQTVLDSSPANGTFSGSLSVKGGWYEIEVIGILDGQEVSTAKVERVGVGEVFLTCGQSNSANYGAPLQAPSDDRVSTYNHNLVEWVHAIDPQPTATGTGGSPWPAFGDRLAQDLDVPVAILSVGIGSTSVVSWTPGGVNYERIRNVLAFLGPNGCRAVLWHQGETDSITGTSTKDYKQRLQSIIDQSRLDCGYDLLWGVAIASWHSGSTESNQANIVAGQLEVIHGDVRVFKGAETDDFHTIYESGVHFNTAGLTEHGRQWAARVREQIFPKPQAAVQIINTQAVSSDQLEIQWNAENNITYQIQSADSLTGNPPVWVNEGGWISGATASISAISCISTQPVRFFRIVLPHTDY